MVDSTLSDLSDPARREIITQSTYRAEVLMQALLKAATDDEDQLRHLVFATVPRLLDLNSVVMSASDDVLEDVPSLQKRMDGGWHRHAVAQP